MRHVIEADCVLANLFAEGMSRVTTPELKDIRDRIERTVAGTFVDISMPTLSYAITYRPDMFAWVEDGIARSPQGRQDVFTREYVTDVFNWRIPQQCRGLFLDAVRSYCQPPTNTGLASPQ